MNDFERLLLLERVLTAASFEEPSSLGKLANDMESLCGSIDGCSVDLMSSFAKLWAALEVVAESCFESGRPISSVEKGDLREMAQAMLGAVRSELNRRGAAA
jgi:hypothetical protein